MMNYSSHLIKNIEEIQGKLLLYSWVIYRSQRLSKLIKIVGWLYDPHLANLEILSDLIKYFINIQSRYFAEIKCLIDRFCNYNDQMFILLLH